ncbi:organic cation transporter 1-like isoform X2 [Danaus plexippus]|uniref:organic cation transporter 1-like isoform X2 n=1 Tax=Danaus plexippus TaxID=13037 RepID=UPI002AB20D7E|nr:organic cation transporter 1-like isoform X2 [Danaus plexippus]
MTWTRELDEAATLATRQGYWHIILFYLLCGLAAIPTSFLVFSQVFTNATPVHWCAPIPEIDELDLPEDVVLNLTVPGVDGVYESCLTYDIDINALNKTLKQITNRSNNVLQGSVQNVLEDKQIESVGDSILMLRKGRVSCKNGWQFQKDLYTRTLVTEFSLVCDREWLPRTSNTLFWVGSIFGNVFFGLLSDRYGRRPTILLMITLEVPLAIAASFPGNYWMFIVLRVAGGLFFPALYQLPFILALELMPPKWRTYAGIVVGMLFGSGMCLLAILAWLLRDWFYLSLASSVPFVLLFGYYWLIPESPRWLVGRGRIADAEKVLRELARRNGIRLDSGFLIELHKKVKNDDDEAQITILRNGQVLSPQTKELKQRKNEMIAYKPTIIINTKSDTEEELSPNDRNEILQPIDKSKIHTLRRKSMQLVNKILLKEEEEDILERNRLDDQNSEGDCKASPLDIFKYPNLRRKFFLLTVNWIAIGVVYNGLSYNTPNLGVDDYLAFFIGGLVELPSYFIAWKSMERFGRRWVLFCFVNVGGVACLCCALVPEAWPWVTVFLAMLGRLCAAASFSVFYVHIGELLPTVLRAQAMACASFIAGIGLLACPYIVSLASLSRDLPLVIMGVLSLFAGVITLFLPETLNQPLPQTLGDGELFGRDFKVLSCVEKNLE